MSAQIVTVTSGKGGVGKTTAAANLGAALAELGHRVVCLDADIGLRNLDVVMGLENRIVYDFVDVVEGRCKLRQAMIRDKRLENLFLIPAAQTRDKTAVSPQDMVRLSRYFDLAPEMPRVDWSKALWHLPVEDIMRNVDGPKGIYADPAPVATGAGA